MRPFIPGAGPGGGQTPEGGSSSGGSLTVSTGESVTDGEAGWLPLVRASSLGDCTGGRVDGVRRVEPVQAGRGGRLTIGLKISAICSLFRVSFSRRARTRLSS